MHYPSYSSDLSPTVYLGLQASQQLFAEKCFHNQQDAENAFQEFAESWSMDLYAAGINKLFFFGKNVLIEMVPILTNKDVFESWFWFMVLPKLIIKLEEHADEKLKSQIG